MFQVVILVEFQAQQALHLEGIAQRWSYQEILVVLALQAQLPLRLLAQALK